MVVRRLFAALVATATLGARASVAQDLGAPSAGAPEVGPAPVAGATELDADRSLPEDFQGGLTAAAPASEDRGNREPASDREETKALMKEAIAEYWEEERERRRLASIRKHDGLYIRLGFNVGYAFDRADPGGPTMRSQGFGSFLDLSVGTNFSESWVYALSYHGLGVFSASTTVDGDPLTRRHGALYQVIGVMLDYYPDPRGGLHVGGTLGAGRANVYVERGERTEAGLGLMMGGGYDAWVGEQWSLGIAARMMIILGASDGFGDHQAAIPMLTLSALHH
jgi:hypothetical protein